MTKQITIAGEKFEIEAPYAEGHQLTEIEAKVLNQTRAENVRNNMAKKIKEMKEANASTQQMAQAVAEYDAEYEFTTPSAGGGTRGLTPVEKEARSIARAVIKAKLAEQGKKVKDIDEEKYKNAVEQLASQDKIMKQAEKVVKQREQAADADLASIGL